MECLAGSTGTADCAALLVEEAALQASPHGLVLVQVACMMLPHVGYHMMVVSCVYRAEAGDTLRNQSCLHLVT